MLRTKSVWSPIDRQRDGLRILATRFRGRGMGTTRYKRVDGIARPQRAPAEGAGKLSWTEFVRRYRAEVATDGPVNAKCATIKNHGQKFTLRLLAKLAEKAT